MITFGVDKSFRHFPSIKLRFISFVLVIFFYTLGDAIMSFMAPNLIENVVENTFFMGIVFSFSSVVGLITDYLLSNGYKEKNFFFYSFIGILIASIFPIIFLLPKNIVIALIAMTIWGIYFEFVLFAKSNYVHRLLSHNQHDISWVFFNASGSLAYLIGPTITMSMLDYGEKLPLYVATAIQIIALIGLVWYSLVFYRRTITTEESKEQQISLIKGLKLWQALNTRLYPVLFYLLLITIVDATFWTIGPVLASSHHSDFVKLFFVFYLLPAFIFAPLGVKLSQYIGKKRTAFIGGMLSGLAFGISLFFNSFDAFMVCIGIGSIFFAISVPEIRGAIEDYCERLGHSANTLVGLTSSMGSLGYIIGPILAGAIAQRVGDQQSFGVIGWFLAGVSLILLIITPRKIRLPQAQLKILES